jgi:hypothetical protein
MLANVSRLRDLEQRQVAIMARLAQLLSDRFIHQIYRPIRTKLVIRL